MDDLGSTGFDEFDRLLAVVRRTRELLDRLIGEGALPAGGAEYIADSTLPHVEGIHDGFRGWLRAGGSDLAELRYLLLRAGELRVQPARGPVDHRAANAETVAEALLAAFRGATPGLPRVHEPDPWHLAALAHARLVLAFLPQVPDDAVRFPGGHRTYADIPAPRGPAELAERIEELERQLWRTATGRTRRLSDPEFRRTYGSFDAADRLGGGATFGLAG